MSLLSSLATASSALRVFNAALETDQTNVSNSATPGFAALRASVNPSGSFSGGLDSVTISSSGSPHADAVFRSASSQANESQTSAGQLEPVNQLLDISGNSGILAALGQFSAAFAGLTITPNDVGGRSAALAAAAGVALAFRKVSASLDEQRRLTDAGIAQTVADINRAASQIRRFNVAVRGREQADPGSEAGLRSALDQLASLTGISVLRNSDGTVSVLAGGRQPLVIEDQVYTLHADLSAEPGNQITSSGGGNAPASYSGALGALLDFRNGALQTLAGGGNAAGSLNELALGFASRVNDLLRSGVTADGAGGAPLFTYDEADASNVARTLAIDPAVTPDQLALGTTGAGARSNGVAEALSGLSSSTQAGDAINGLSPEELFAALAAGAGRRLSDARSQSVTDQTALTSAQVARQQVSGVSLDQEAVSITAYQRSYQASARLISILDQLTSDEVNLIK